MGRERLWWGGVDVASWAVRAIDLSGLLAVPERRGENVEVGGRHGSIRTPRKKYSGRELVVEFWVRGTLPDGTVPEDPPQVFYDNLRTLARLIAQEELPLVHQLPDGTVREIPVEVTAAFAPDRFKTGDLAKVKIAFTSSEAFWRAQEVTTVAAALGSGGTRALDEFGPSDAPVDDVTVTFGPGPGRTLTAVESGLWLRYNATIPTGQTLVIDCGRKQLTGAGGLVPDRRLLQVHPEDGRWLAVDPVLDGPPTIRLDHGGGSASVPVSIAARQKWMFG